MRSQITNYYHSNQFIVGEINFQALKLYSDSKIETGSFLRYVLEGDLYSAARCADLNNQQRLYHIVNYIVKNMPEESYGSKEKVKLWLKRN